MVFSLETIEYIIDSKTSGEILPISGISILVKSGLIEAFKSGNYKLMPEHIDLPGTSVHWFFAMVIIFLLVLHVVGTIKHYLLTKENALKRIF